MSGPLDAYDPAPLPARAAGALPQSSFGDVFAASRTLAEGDRTDADYYWTKRGYAPLIDALKLDPSQNPAEYEDLSPAVRMRFGDMRRRSDLVGDSFGATRREQEEAIFGRIAAERRRNPGFMPGVPASVDDFHDYLRKQQHEHNDEARGVIERGGRGSSIANLGGGFRELATDPINVMFLPMGGGGTTVARSVLRGALINGGIVAALQPHVAVNRHELSGEELTLTEAGTNILSAAAFGGLVEGGLHLGGLTKDALTPLDRKVARALESADLPDTALPGLARGAIGWDALTPDQQAAAHVLERQGEVDASSPFARGGPSIETHGDRLAEAIDTITRETPRMEIDPRTIGDGVPRETRPSPLAAGSGADRLMQRIGVVESGGDATARNPRSSASGTFQFTDGTFLRLYKQRYGSADKDFTILTRKNRPELQAQLMRDLTAGNAQALARAGEAESAGNLYLAHFAGSEGALKILKAAPDTPVERLLGARAIEANPFLKGKSAAELIAWAHAKMGEPGFEGGRVQLAREGFGGGDYGEALWRGAQADLDAQTMAKVAARKEAAASQVFDPETGDFLPENRGGAIDEAETLRPWQQDAPEAVPEISRKPAPDPAAVQLVPGVSAAISDRAVSLDPAKLAARLDTTEALARQALDLVAARPGSGLVPGKTGGWRRALVRREESDIVTLVADGGGVRDEMKRTGGYGAHDMAERLKALVPGAGPLHRRTGRSLDEWGETLHELGWFKDRPSTAEVLDLLERGVAAYGGPKDKRIYHPESTAPETVTRGAEEQQLHDQLHDTAGSMGVTLDDALAERAAALIELHDGEDLDFALSRAIYDALDEAGEEVRAAALLETGDSRYDFEFGANDARHTDPGAEPDSGRSPGEPGDAGEGGAGGAQPGGPGEASVDALDAEGLGPPGSIEPYRVFDDPAGEGAKAQIDSLEHDLRMQVEATVPQSAAGDGMLGPASVLSLAPKEGALGISIRNDDGHLITAFWRDADGKARGAVQLAVSPEAREIYDGVSTYVDPAFRRQGIATKLYDALKEAGHPIDEMSGAGDLTPDGAALVNSRRKAALDRGEAADPNIAAREKQQTQLAAAAPMRAQKEQDGTMGLGLFAAADQPSFRLDLDGEQKPLADILKELDDEAAAIEALRACTLPGKGA